MSGATYRLARRALFALDAERAHNVTLGILGWAPTLLGGLAQRALRPPPPGEWRIGPLRVSHPIGLAAGLDKNGVAIPFWPSLGFGFIEVGTVTAHAQPGNPSPRLFRLVDERAIINRMGFNNAGSEALAHQMRTLRDRGRWPDVPVGANLGKSKRTANEDAADDYALSARRLRGLADYFTINVSSPNTPGLRALQDASALRALLPRVREAAAETPTFLKIAPDLEPEAIAEAVELAITSGMDGLIATNTTIRRDLLRVDPDETGGLSGRPLWPHARERIRIALEASRGRLPVIGVGGIESEAQAVELLAAGCAAVQVYTALIYEGPALPSRIAHAAANWASTRLTPSAGGLLDEGPVRK